MPKVLKIKKSIELHLDGAVPEGSRPRQITTERIAMTPDDFNGVTPKLDVRQGDTVVKGQPLWHDKTDNAIKIVSPVSGTVVDVVRGEKRKLLRVVVEVGHDATAEKRTSTIPHTAQEIKEAIKSAGLWAMMRQLPYDIVPVDNREPRDMFISAWDSAPMAAGYTEYLTPENRKYLRAGVGVLKKLTSGNIYIGTGNGVELDAMPDATIVPMEGGFPASLPSVLAANVSPVNKGETVWLMGVETAVRIGQLFSGEEPDWTFPVAVTGSCLDRPCMVVVPAGAEVKPLILEAHLRNDGHNFRVISGNVFVGDKIGEDSYLRFPYRQVTVIPEGDDTVEFMGWASMSPEKMSRNRSFPAFFFKSRLFNPDARLNGGRRAMIMSGEYDRYIPMDIMAEYLIKAILARDIDRMEQLGIYEVTPADFAAAEYADTSKLELQRIVREGLDYMIKEVGTGD